MANNKIGDSDTYCQIKETNCLVNCNTLNATNGDSSTSENGKFFRRILNYLRIRRNKKKKCNTKKRNVSTCRSEEKISACTSSIIDNVIKSDVEVVLQLKQKMVDAITSTTRASTVFDRVTQENLSCAIEHFIRGASYRYAEYTAKDVDDVVPESDCGPLCVRTQRVAMDGEICVETSPDAFAEVCEKRRHMDFILKEIAKVSDALTEKARLASAKEQVRLKSVLITPTKYEIEKERRRTAEPLIIIPAEEEPTAVVKKIPTAVAEEIPTVVVKEEPNDVEAATTTVMQPEIYKKILESPPKDFRSSDSQKSLAKSVDASDVQVKPLVRKKDRARTVSVYPERELQDIAAIVAKKEKEEKEEVPKKDSRRQMLDERVVTDETNNCTKNCVIVNCIPKLKKKKRRVDKSDDPLRQKVVDKIDSSIKPSDKKELIQITKDIPQKSLKYRAKYRIDTTHILKKEKEPQLKKVPRDSDQFPKCMGVVSLPEAWRTPKVFERPTTSMYQDCQCRRTSSFEYLEPTRYCKDLIPSVYLRRPKCCDVCTAPCLSSGTLNGALSQDSCATKYYASCHSLIDSSSRCCNINCTKHRVTFENSLCANTYCRSNVKYCYPHLNNIDNVRMRYYHCNDIYPTWNNNQQCGRDRSYYWTTGNLYFTHPWTSENLLQYN